MHRSRSCRFSPPSLPFFISGSSPAGRWHGVPTSCLWFGHASWVVLVQGSAQAGALNRLHVPSTPIGPTRRSSPFLQKIFYGGTIIIAMVAMKVIFPDFRKHGTSLSDCFPSAFTHLIANVSHLLYR